MAKRKRKAKQAAGRPRKATPRAIEAALAGLAHDLRTPLTGILALADLLAASELPDRERQWARAIKSGAEHLAALSNLIVDAARADAAGLVLQAEPFSPRALADTVAEAISARAANKGLGCTIAITSRLPDRAAGDLLRLRAALENLADNAVKFTASGAVRFAVDAEPARGKRVRLVFTFADTGIGLSPSEARQLFRPYAQASADVARRYGGAGLGLTFVKRLAKAMGGDLTVESRKGKGSTFRLSVLVDAAPPAQASGQAVGRARLKLKILCAEDNPYARVVMNTVLGELGHTVDFAETGEAAVEAAARGRYDAVLMDVALPGIDGLEATRRIRALPGAGGRVLVVGLSAKADSDAAARAAGMDAFLVKPVTPSLLAEALTLGSSAPRSSPDRT
jgi:CheY-like chemotaxis protein